MKNLTLLLVSFFLIGFVSCTNSGKKETVESEPVKAAEDDGWELLFDGKSLDNWKLFNDGEVTGWKIVDGILENSGVGSDHGGDIITKKQYKNFELVVEWNIDPESNSGIFFHVQEGNTDAIYKSGPEYQLIDDTGWPGELEASQYSGANYGMHAPEGAEKVKAGEWNTSKIIVNGTHVENWLNGIKVVDYELWDDDWKARKANSKWAEEPFYGISETGSIGLQDHGGLTKFRVIKIKEL
ncbi:MAG: DUF1080 domain-containing protein [Prolixibacteraceae bacterium]|nr:DUF1080 domain-containing protein [Prolixibacteraceae bacterium]MBN2774286.1 DUF1080 domain-containing protein [Prolixibacteraceae bacterium]